MRFILRQVGLAGSNVISVLFGQWDFSNKHHSGQYLTGGF